MNLLFNITIGITQIDAQNIIVISLRPRNNISRHTYIYPENVNSNKYFMKFLISIFHITPITFHLIQVHFLQDTPRLEHTAEG